MKASSFAVLLLVGVTTTANHHACATSGSTASTVEEGVRAVGGTQIVSLYKVRPGRARGRV